MKKVVRVIMCCVVLLLAVEAKSEERDSRNFVGVMYECDTLPSLNAIPWDIAQTDATVETTYSSTDGDLLEVDTYPAGAVSWWLVGQKGGAVAPPANRHWPNYPDPEAVDNPWNQDITIGYTMEVSLEMLESTPGTWGYSFWLCESNDGAATALNIFTDKITCSYGPTTLYTGDLTGGQHKIRFVRYPGSMSDPFADPTMALYVDGELSYTGGKWGEGGIMVPSAWDQDYVLMGNLSGEAHYHVIQDYVRFDFTGPYEPYTGADPVCGDFGYLKSDLNTDCEVNLLDFALLALTWLDCTDPTDPACISCTNPANAEICQP